MSGIFYTTGKLLLAVLIVLLLHQTHGQTHGPCDKVGSPSGCGTSCKNDSECSDPNEICLCNGRCGYNCLVSTTAATTTPAIVLFMDHTDGQESCPRDEAKAQRFDPSRTCRKACTNDSDCSGASKSCTCDYGCGFSCFDPDAVCDEVLSIGNGSITYTYLSGATGTDKVYDTRAWHRCDSGYHLLGEMYRYCRSDRQWSHSHNVPNCTRVCVSPGRIADGISTTYGPFYVGDKVTIQCVTGYDAEAGSVLERTCQADYTWSDVAYTCRLQQCGPPDDVSHGSYTVRDGKTGDEQFGFGAWVDYECDTGYNRDAGKDSYSCAFHGDDDSVSWKASSEVWPTCVAVECPPPTAPENGEHDSAGITEFTFGYQVTYSCDTGYKLIGNKKGQCNATGGWGETPKCEGSVDEDFSSRSNSYTTTSGSFTWTEGTQISGLIGYFMQGDGTIQSVPISLTKDQRICVKADHSETEANELEARAFNNGQTKDLFSFPASQDWTSTTFWLELVDNNADEQVWLQFVSSDNVRIDNIKEVAESQCVTTATTTPASVTTATTTPASGVCVAPGRVADGIPTTFGPFYVGDKVTIRCITGYDAEAGSVLERMCQADYTWSDVGYTCRPQQCGPPANVSHGSYTVHGETEDEQIGLGAWVNYECDTGYIREAGKDSYSCTVRSAIFDTLSWKASYEDWPTCVATVATTTPASVPTEQNAEITTTSGAKGLVLSPVAFCTFITAVILVLQI